MKNIGSYPNIRLRRNRKTDWSRRLVRESALSTNDLIWPIFISEGKNIKGSEALNKKNLICKALKLIKKNYVDNDKTIKILIKQSILQAEMGCDVIAPSDMMDGRIGEIRKALDKNGFKLVLILSYAVKYASNFYGPFRSAVGSSKSLIGNKKNYQMDFFNSKEALREVALDIKEGADFVMVKPGMPYLDIIKLRNENFKIPVFAYQVSG